MLLGEPSNHLIDIDFDSEIAKDLAEHFLPETNCVFGRKSNKTSHFLYYADLQTIKFIDPMFTKTAGKPDRAMLFEVRS